MFQTCRDGTSLKKIEQIQFLGFFRTIDYIAVHNYFKLRLNKCGLFPDYVFPNFGMKKPGDSHYYYPMNIIYQFGIVGVSTVNDVIYIFLQLWKR